MDFERVSATTEREHVSATTEREHVSATSEREHVSVTSEREGSVAEVEVVVRMDGGEITR